MRTANTVAVMALGVVLGGVLVPALAHSALTIMPDDGVGRQRHGMSGGMMHRGCVGMMQSMNGGGGRPNSQWQARPPGGGSMVN